MNMEGLLKPVKHQPQGILNTVVKGQAHSGMFFEMSILIGAQLL